MKIQAKFFRDMPVGSNGIERYMLAMGKTVIPPIVRIGNRIREEDGGEEDVP
jgi:hypothetical protein